MISVNQKASYLDTKVVHVLGTQLKDAGAGSDASYYHTLFCPKSALSQNLAIRYKNWLLSLVHLGQRTTPIVAAYDPGSMQLRGILRISSSPHFSLLLLVVLCYNVPSSTLQMAHAPYLKSSQRGT